jgi:hypothetical protein
MAGDRAPFLSGGGGSMHPATGVGTQKPGQSSQEGKSSISSSQEPEAGGPGEGFYSSGATNKDYAGPQASGTSGPTKSGGNAKFAEGGKSAMFGNRGSMPAKAGQTTP